MTDLSVHSISALRVSFGETNEPMLTEADVPPVVCDEEIEAEFLS